MKTLTKSLLLAMLMMWPYGLFAQFPQQEYQAVVYLRNGNIIRGTITEIIPDKQIKIRTAAGSILVYLTEEVERIDRENQPKPSPEQPGNEKLKRGYFGALDFGYGFDINSVDRSLYKFNMVHGCRLNPYLAIGLGTGTRLIPGDELLIPLFAHIRVNFLNRKVTPYFALNAGYSFNASIEDIAEGYMINPDLGVTFMIKRIPDFHLGIGCDVQRFKYGDAFLPDHQSSLRFENMYTISFYLGFTM